MFHWMEEVQHAILDELEWVRETHRLTLRQKEQAVDDLIALVGAVDAHPAGAGRGGRRLLPARRPAGRLRRAGGSSIRRADPAGLPMAVHRLGCAASALHQVAWLDDDPRPDEADPVCTAAHRLGLNWPSVVEEIHHEKRQ